MKRPYHSKSGLKRGFTLVELLVVIAIIGILVALLLPAIQAAREAARRTQCKNQLRQLALSFQLHHDTHKFFPSGGWGNRWLGFPEQGYGKNQSGSWLYSVLPYMEEGNLYNLGKGTTGQARRDACKQRSASPFEGMTCPSRRKANVYPFDGPTTFRYCTSPLELCSKTDYAANGGTVHSPEIDDGPTENGEDLMAVKANDWESNAAGEKKAAWDGIVFYRSEIGVRQITDGTSKTYMVGEKWMYYENYDTGRDTGDGEPAFSANNDDTIRVANRDWPLSPDTQQTKLNATSAPLERRTFGSAHTGGFNMAMCDGSVDFVGIDIDHDVHAWRASRNDGDKNPEQTTNR